MCVCASVVDIWICSSVKVWVMSHTSIPQWWVSSSTTVHSPCGALPVASGEKLLTEVTVAEGGVSGGSMLGQRLLSRGLSVPPAPPGSTSREEQQSLFSIRVWLISCWTMSTFFPQSSSRGGDCSGDWGGQGEDLLSPSWEGLLDDGRESERGAGLSDNEESGCLSSSDATLSQCSPISWYDSSLSLLDCSSFISSSSPSASSSLFSKAS